MFFKDKESLVKIDVLEQELSNYKLHIENLENEKRTLSERINSLNNENNKLNSSNSDLLNKLNSIERLHTEQINQQNDHQIFEDFFIIQNENLKSGLLDIQGNISQSTELSRETLSVSSEIQSIYKSSTNELSAIVKNLEKLNEGSDEVSSVVNDLGSKSEEISGSISLIHAIVLQINILSLNAAVEAATAGEAGKGFAVVAGEVKNLANKTAEAARQIDESVKQIQASIKKTNERFDNFKITIDDISNKTHTYNDNMSQVFNTSQKAFSGIETITDRVFMSLAKLDHIIWKVNTYLSVAHKKPAFNFVDHKNCRLGKWYNEGYGKRYFSTTPSYSKLDRPHAVVHNGTHKVFDSIENANNIDYAKAFNALQEMEQASKEVFSLLDKMLDERSFKM